MAGRWVTVAAAASLMAGPAMAQEPDSTATPVEATDIAGKLESLTEQVQTLQSDTDRLKRFKFSGYVQVRWEHGEDQFNDVTFGSNSVVAVNNRERVYIRRA